MCSFLLSELQVGNNITVMSSYVTDMCSFLQGLTQVEEMLISGVLPIMSLYRLPHGQYAYSGHVINLPQDMASFINSLPRLPTELDIIVVRKQGAADSHHDFRVRRSVVLAALQWLLANNQYYCSVQINSDALALLPEDGNLTGLRSVTLDSVADDSEAPSVEDVDPYDAHLSGSFVPNTTQRLTEEETVRQSVQERQSHQQPVSPPTVSWPPSGLTPINEFSTEGYISCAFPTLFPTLTLTLTLTLTSSGLPHDALHLPSIIVSTFLTLGAHALVLMDVKMAL